MPRGGGATVFTGGGGATIFTGGAGATTFTGGGGATIFAVFRDDLRKEESANELLSDNFVCGAGLAGAAPVLPIL